MIFFICNLVVFTVSQVYKIITKTFMIKKMFYHKAYSLFKTIIFGPCIPKEYIKQQRKQFG